MNLKAIGWGWVTYAFGHIGYLVIINTLESHAGYLSYLLYVVAFVGGVITGRLSRKKPIINLVVVGVLMGVSAGGINYLYWLLGFPADFGGFKGFQIVVAFTIPLFTLLSLFGGALGGRDEAQ